MNNFTKAELEEIAECVWIHNDLRDNDPATYSPLLKKIESMIDNYCEPNPNKPNFTQDQKDFICYQIGDWYLMMKPLLEGQHNLGYMKEKLKIMVCDDEMPTNC